MSTFLPLSDKILVKRVAAETKSPGGIVIPDAAKEKPSEGIVIAVGPGRVLDSGARLEPHVKKGDHILFGKYSGTEARALGEDHVIIREDDILCVKRED